MPALQQSVLKPDLEAAFKMILDDKGDPYFVKRNLDGTVATPLELSDGAKKMIEAISLGIAVSWAKWQAAQTVNGAAMVAGPYPVTGVTLPGSLI